MGVKIALTICIMGVMYGLIIVGMLVYKDKKLYINGMCLSGSLLVVGFTTYSIVLSIFEGEKTSDLTVLLLVVSAIQSVREIVDIGDKIEKKTVDKKITAPKESPKSYRKNRRGIIILILSIFIVIAPSALLAISSWLGGITGLEDTLITFVGNYYGIILGGVFSGLVAIMVMVTTFNNEKKQRKRDDVLAFLDKIMINSAELLKCVEETTYYAVEYVEMATGKKNDILLLNDFLRAKRNARTIALNISLQLRAKENDEFCRTNENKELCEIIEEIYEKLDEHGISVMSVTQYEGELKEQCEEIYALANSFEDALIKYTKDIIEKCNKNCTH